LVVKGEFDKGVGNYSKSYEEENFSSNKDAEELYTAVKARSVGAWKVPVPPVTIAVSSKGTNRMCTFISFIQGMNRHFLLPSCKTPEDLIHASAAYFEKIYWFHPR
jgi:hypothetical protein